MNITYKIEITELTILAINTRTGEVDDLNAEGEPCRTYDDLASFVVEAHEQGAYDHDTMVALTRQLAEEAPVVPVEAISVILDEEGVSATLFWVEAMGGDRAALPLDTVQDCIADVRGAR